MVALVITHFEAPESRQKDLQPFQTKLLSESHPKNNFCETENPSPVP